MSQLSSPSTRKESEFEDERPHAFGSRADFVRKKALLPPGIVKELQKPQFIGNLVKFASFKDSGKRDEEAVFQLVLFIFFFVCIQPHVNHVFVCVFISVCLSARNKNTNSFNSSFKEYQIKGRHRERGLLSFSLS